MNKTRTIKVPAPLAYLITINVAYKVVLCIGCRRAVSPASIVEHLRRCHKTPLKVRKQVQAFIQSVPWAYDYTSIALPADGLPPQPVVPVVEGFHCQQCPFRTQSRKNMKVHGNREHAMKRVSDKQLYQVVRLQTWFRDGKERYWVVNESQQAAQER